MPQLIENENQITADWLAAVLGLDAASDVEVAAIGTGQMSRSLRASYQTHSGAGSVVVKIPSDDPASRATGVGLGAYARETAFYERLSGELEGAVPTCHMAEFDPADGSFTIVIADASPARQGDQIAGCSAEQAHRALQVLAAIQAPTLGDPVLGSAGWLNHVSPLNQPLYGAMLPGFLERYAGQFAPEHAAVLEAFAGRVDAWAADRRAPLGLAHGDFRLDNLLFDTDRCVVVDWQTVSWGSALLDVSYFLGGSLTVPDRRAHEHDLVRGYYEALVAAGAHALSWEACWEEYRRQAFHGVLMGVIAAMVVERTERGDELFLTVTARCCDQIIDLDALALLPEDGAAPVAALRPEP